MNVKELMIGDLVQPRGGTTPTAVAGLTSGKIHTIWADGSKHSKDAYYFDPIPLTDEILEKNGWVKYGTPYEWRDGINVQEWCHTRRIVSFGILQMLEGAGYTWRGIEISEVHRFQHALRLYGLNDLADNFKV